MTAQISSRGSFSDEDASKMTCLSKIGQEFKFLLSATEDAVQQLVARCNKLRGICSIDVAVAVAASWAAVRESNNIAVMKGNRSNISAKTHTRDQCRALG